MASIDIAVMRQLVSALETALSELPRHKSTLVGIMENVGVGSSDASRLDRVVTWGHEELPGLKRRLALAVQIEAQDPSLNGVGVASIDESQLPTDSPAVAIQKGKTAAEQLKNSKGDPSDDLLKAIQAGQNDPYFAQGFATSVTPKELADVAIAMSNRRDGIDANSTDATKNYADWAKKYEAILSAVGTTVGTATRNTGDLALPSSYADDWTRTITEAPPIDGGRATPGQGAAAALFLRYGQYSTPFLDHVGSGVYDYERANNGNGPLWGPRSTINSTYMGPYSPDGGHPYDPMASIMYAFGNNPEASQTFFDGGKTETVKVDGREVSVNSRMKYLIQDRVWPDDEADGLGKALEAATTTFRDRSPAGQISAKIAGQTFALVGERTGQGADGGFIGLGADNGWEMYKGMRDSMANMVASYSPDLFRLTNETDPKDPGNWTKASNTGFPPGGPYGAWMDKALMQKLIATLGEDEKNFNTVLAGVQGAQQLRMSYALDKSLLDNPDAPVQLIKGLTVPLVETASDEGARTFGWIINDSYLGKKLDEDTAKKRAEALKNVLDTVSGLPFVPTPKGEWTGALLDYAKSQVLDKIGEGPPPTADQTYSGVDATTKTQLPNGVLNTMLQAGYFDQKYYDKANAPGPGQTYQAPPPEALAKGADGKPKDPPQFDFSSDAYTNWRRTYAPSGWLNTNVTTPYDSSFPNIGD